MEADKAWRHLRIENPSAPSGLSETIGHMPFAETAIDKSVTTQVAAGVSVADDNDRALGVRSVVGGGIGSPSKGVSAIRHHVRQTSWSRDDRAFKSSGTQTAGVRLGGRHSRRSFLAYPERDLISRLVALACGCKP